MKGMILQNLMLLDGNEMLGSGANPGIFVTGTGFRGRHENWGRSAQELRAKPESRAKPETRAGGRGPPQKIFAKSILKWCNLGHTLCTSKLPDQANCLICPDANTNPMMIELNHPYPIPRQGQQQQPEKHHGQEKQQQQCREAEAANI